MSRTVHRQRPYALVGDCGLPDIIWERYATIESCQLKQSGNDVLLKIVDDGDQLHTFMAFPIGVDGQLGKLCLGLNEGRSLSYENRAFISRYCNNLGYVIERINAEARLNHQANHNELSGLPNRRLLTTWASGWWEKALAEQKKRAIVMVDVLKLKENQ